MARPWRLLGFSGKLARLIPAISIFLFATLPAFVVLGAAIPAQAATAAKITSPAPGSRLLGSSATFSWDAGSGVSQYFLYVGTSLGSNNLYGQSLGNRRSATVTGLPTDGRTLHVRLWSWTGSAWLPRDYTYTAAMLTGQKAALTSPSPSSKLAGPTVTFAWNSGSGVAEYFLYVGTSVGGNNLYARSLGTNRSVMVPSLPTNNRVVYVRLYSLLGGNWQYNDYTYTAATAGFMSSPLACGDPKCTFRYTQGVYTPGIINSVLDHSLQKNPSSGWWQYGFLYDGGGNGIVVSFTGETANGPPKSAGKNSSNHCIAGKLDLVPAPGAGALANSGACGSGYATYDEHPGYDFRAATGTPVMAVADGTVLNIGGEYCYKSNISVACANWGYVGIDHGNGYISQYGHLSKIYVVPGQKSIKRGQVIGLSGNTAPSSAGALGAHLHFEVLKVVNGHFLIVDPYGWIGIGADKLSAYSGITVPPARLWQ